MKVQLSNSIIEINKLTKHITCETIDNQPIIYVYDENLDVVRIYPKTKELAEKDYSKLSKAIKTLYPKIIKNTSEE